MPLSTCNEPKLFVMFVIVIIFFGVISNVVQSLNCLLFATIHEGKPVYLLNILVIDAQILSRSWCCDDAKVMESMRSPYWSGKIIITF